MYIFGHMAFIFVCVCVFFGFFFKLVKKDDSDIQFINLKNASHKFEKYNQYNDLKLKEDFSKVMIFENGKINICQNEKRGIL